MSIQFVSRIMIIVALIATLSVRGAADDLSLDYVEGFPDLRSSSLTSILPVDHDEARSNADQASVTLLVGKTQAGRGCLVVVNPFPWLEQIDIEWQGSAPRDIQRLTAASLPAADALSSRSSSTPAIEVRTHHLWRIQLAGTSMAAWTFPEGAGRIASWSHRADTDAITMVDRRLDELSQSLTRASLPQTFSALPFEGSFEEMGDEPTSLPKQWLVSLNPSTPFLLSNLQARTGKYSMHYRSRQPGTVGWIQTPEFPLDTESGVAAAVWIRVDAEHPLPTIHATTTLIAASGERREWKQAHPPSSLTMAHRTWHRIDFPVLTNRSTGQALPAESRVRLSLDIEGPTSLWIDDYSGYSMILEEDERRQVRSQLFVARRELAKNRPFAAWRLLQSDLFRRVHRPGASASPPAFESTAEDVLTNTTTPNAPRQAGRGSTQR